MYRLIDVIVSRNVFNPLNISQCRVTATVACARLCVLAFLLKSFLVPRQSGTGAAAGNKCKGKGTSGHQRAPAGTRQAGTRRALDQRRPATTIGHPGSSGQRQRQRHCRNCCSHEGSITLPRRLAQQHRYFCLRVSADSFFVQIWQHCNSLFMDLAASSGSNIRRQCDVRFFQLQHFRQDIVPARQCCRSRSACLLLSASSVSTPSICMTRTIQLCLCRVMVNTSSTSIVGRETQRLLPLGNAHAGRTKNRVVAMS